MIIEPTRSGRRGSELACGRGPAALLDICDGHYCGSVRDDLRLVVGADALDVAAAPVGGSGGCLHAAFGDKNAQVGAVEPEVTGRVDAHEEGLVLTGDLVPVVADPVEGERPAVGQMPGTGTRRGEDTLDRVTRLFHDQLRPDVHGCELAPALVDLLA